MKLLKTLVAIIALSIPTMASAEHAIGFAAGATKGVGLTYRNINEDTNLGVQITGIPVAAENSGFLSGGVSALLLLNMSNKGKAFVTVGTGILHSWEGDEEMTLVGIGPGIGFEFQLAPGIGLSLELPIAAIFGADVITEAGVQRVELGLRAIMPLPSASLVYIW